MRINKCPKCGKTQQQGTFCLDDGTRLVEVVTSNIQFKKINSSRGSDQLKHDIRSWLVRVGVQQPDIKISSSQGISAQVEYILNKNHYSFSSHLQDSITNNLAAVEQFLHSRVLSIERGIETVEKAFAGYEQLPDYTEGAEFNPYHALGFSDKVSLEEASVKFKEMAKRYHPDVNKTDIAQEQFRRIKKAIDMIEAESR